MSLLYIIILLITGSLLLVSSLSIIIRNKDIIELPQLYRTFSNIKRQKYQFYLQFIIGICLIIYGMLLY